MTVDEDLDALYGVTPEEFTALRKTLAAAAKKAGDADGAKEIAAARRPTTAAWVVNRLVRVEPSARDRLREMTAELRAAHAAMDGPRIRDLTAAQRRLVGDLVAAAFAAAELGDPSAALRDDVTDTLQAAIADPEVASRLGRLVKAEQWSGFGDFGAPDVALPLPESAPRVDRRALERAEKVRATAATAVADLTAELAAARRRYEKVLESLAGAEHAVNVAEGELADANDALAEADSALKALRGESPT
jgi:hypothetical protein